MGLSLRDFEPIYSKVKAFKNAGYTITTACGFSRISINRFNYYVRKYNLDTLKTPKISEELFDKIYDKIEKRVLGGSTIKKACLNEGIQSHVFYWHLKEYNKPKIETGRNISRADFETLYDQVYELVSNGNGIIKSCNDLGVDYYYFTKNRLKFAKPVIKKN